MTRVKLALIALLALLVFPMAASASGGHGGHGNGCGRGGCGYGYNQPPNFTDYRNAYPWNCPPYERYQYTWRQFPSGDGGYVTPGNGYLPLYSSPGNGYYPYSGGYSGNGYYH